MRQLESLLGWGSGASFRIPFMNTSTTKTIMGSHDTTTAPAIATMLRAPCYRASASLVMFMLSPTRRSTQARALLLLNYLTPQPPASIKTN